MAKKSFSVYLAFLLRHAPDTLGLKMDKNGYVSVDELIQRVNLQGEYRIDRALLSKTVEGDAKGRYRFSEDGTKIKACQGHSIEFVEPMLTVGAPPALLYHGTTAKAYEMILSSGGISKMSRHAVHMQAEREKAWESARRWKEVPVLLVIDAEKMHADGFILGVTENGVWCTEQVPAKYIKEALR